MPWCEDCEKYYAPSAMTAEGHCPRCGADLLAPDAADQADPATTAADEKAPWHFKVMVVLLVVYLVWRFVEIFTG